MNDVDARVVTDIHTHTQDKYHNPPAHAHRGLKMGGGAYSYIILLSKLHLVLSLIIAMESL